MHTPEKEKSTDLPQENSPNVASDRVFQYSEPLHARLWTLWPGKNRFCCDGHLMIGPSSDMLKCSIAWGLFVIIEAAYFVFISPFLWVNVSPLLPICNGVLALQTCFFSVCVLLVEPGILPRKKIFELTSQVPEEFTREVINKLEDGAAYKLCSTCDVYRPPKAHHCRVCDNCVLAFDHHCPYLNSCIGLRNYRYFLLLIISLLFLGASDVAGLIAFLASGEDHGEKAVTSNEEAALVVVGVLCTAVVMLLFLVMTLFFLQAAACFGQWRGPKGYWSRHKSLFNRRQFVPEAITLVSETSVAEVTREISKDANTA